jgi:hypothetical protein
VEKFWGHFFEGFLLDVTFEDLVPLCSVILLQQTLRNGFDFGGFCVLRVLEVEARVSHFRELSGV